MSIQFKDHNDILVYTAEKKMKYCSMVDIKNLNINYKGWYCPISEHSLYASDQGWFWGGVCQQIKFNTSRNPWWDGIDLKSNVDPICKFKKNVCRCGADINAIKAINKEIYDEFIHYAKGYKVFEKLKDDDEIIALGHRKMVTGKRLFEFTLNYGRRCNYDCSYCSPEIHDNHSPFLSFDNIFFLFSELELNKNNTNCFRITGGEPTLGKDLESIIQLAKAKGFDRITINSNGTAKDYKYENFAELGCKINMSIHHEFTNDKVLERMLRLKLKYPYHFSIKFMIGIEKNNTRERVEKIFKDHLDFLEYSPIFILPENETSYESLSADVKPIRIFKNISVQEP